MWRLWQGELWRDIAAFCTLWVLGVGLYQKLRTHYLWTKKTLLYILVGSILITVVVVAYRMYQDKLHNNAQYTQIAAHQQVSVQPLGALSLLTGTMENPILVCKGEGAVLKVGAFQSDRVMITFLGVGLVYRRDPIHLRVGGEPVDVMEDGKRVTTDTREISEPLDLRPLLVSGLNRLHFYVEPYDSTDIVASYRDTDAMALVVRLVRNNTEQVLRLSYLYGGRDKGWPVTDIYFNVEPCGK